MYGGNLLVVQINRKSGRRTAALTHDQLFHQPSRRQLDHEGTVGLARWHNLGIVVGKQPFVDMYRHVLSLQELTLTHRQRLTGKRLNRLLTQTQHKIAVVLERGAQQVLNFFKLFVAVPLGEYFVTPIKIEKQPTNTIQSAENIAQILVN